MSPFDSAGPACGAAPTPTPVARAAFRNSRRLSSLPAATFSARRPAAVSAHFPFAAFSINLLSSVTFQVSPVSESNSNPFFGSARPSRAPDQNPHQKNQHSAKDNLHHGGRPWRIHEPPPYPGDQPQFHEYHRHRDPGGRAHVRNQIGQAVPQPAQGSHQPANRSARPRMSPACEAPIVRERFGETHTDTGAKAGSNADPKCCPTVVRSEGRSE